MRAPVPAEISAHTAARKLQDAVDETQSLERKRIDLGRKIEVASKLHCEREMIPRF